MTGTTRDVATRTISVPDAPDTPLAHLRWTLADTWTLTLRGINHWIRQPFMVLAGWAFMIMLVAMYGLLFGGAMRVPGGGNYMEFLLPGMFVMTMAFGIGETMSAVATDAERGVTDRFRSMPMAASAVVVGRCAADLLNSALALVVLIACGLAVGWRAHGGAAEFALAVGLLLLLRFALLWLGIYLGLLAGRPELVMAVQILVWPIGFLSNVFAAPGTMPGWLGTIAEWNPLSATAAATRALFGNPGWGDGSWPAEHALALAIGWPILITAVFFPLSVRRYQRLSR
jgi:ABC-type multidrug transport system permease subunit